MCLYVCIFSCPELLEVTKNKWYHVVITVWVMFLAYLCLPANVAKIYRKMPQVDFRVNYNMGSDDQGSVTLEQVNSTQVSTFLPIHIYFLGKDVFEKVVIYCDSIGGTFSSVVTFVMGFYVSVLVSRWYKKFDSLPWPAATAMWISTCFNGK